MPPSQRITIRLSPNLAATLAALSTRLTDIEQRLDALEAAATRPPQPSPRQPTRPRPAARADTAGPAYDSTKFVLGRLCPRGHAFGDTGLTLRRRHNQSCVTCATEQQRERRAARREGRG